MVCIHQLTYLPSQLWMSRFSNSPSSKTNAGKNILAHVSTDLLLWQCVFTDSGNIFSIFLCKFLPLHFPVLFMELLIVECWTNPLIFLFLFYFLSDFINFIFQSFTTSLFSLHVYIFTLIHVTSM